MNNVLKAILFHLKEVDVLEQEVARHIAGNRFWDREEVARNEWDQVLKNCYQTADGLVT